jgi:cation transport regulator
MMPYDNLSDLPDSMSNNLPQHAQEIYRAAYNSAEDQYGEESRAHWVAWSAGRTSTRRTNRTTG